MTHNGYLRAVSYTHLDVYKGQDQGCCPGHDKFPYESYGSRVSMKLKRRTDQLAHRRARSWERQEIFKELNDIF